MAAGGPGDHPLKDILHFDMNVYDTECDNLIRELAKYVPENILYQSIDLSTAFNIDETILIDLKKELLEKLNFEKNKAKS
ncbi:hypothetical protein [Flavobacterium sp.]|uniref:hypothetical protein n=1 Tax=Flavobacterium sp. TaxID=239 RepID=UPI003265DFD4